MLAPYISAMLDPSAKVYRPVEAILLPTLACNLACRYCYADSNSELGIMPLEIAQAAIDWVVQNAQTMKSNNLGLVFHGGGEPFVAWPFLRQIIQYARRKASSAGIGLRTKLFSNGYLNDEQRQWLVENAHHVTISLDGPPDIQDYLRPTRQGQPSSAVVGATCQYLAQAEMPFSVRATLTNETVHRLQDIIDYVKNLGGTVVQVEPLFLAGRACGSVNLKPPSAQDFARQFVVAKNYAAQHGMTLFYSGVGLSRRNGSFCRAAGENLVVNWRGEVSGCYVAGSGDDSALELLRYGRFEWPTHQFTFQFEKIKRLRERNCSTLPGCANCSIVDECAGECLAKAGLEKGIFDPSGTTRCQINRLICQISEPSAD